MCKFGMTKAKEAGSTSELQRTSLDHSSGRKMWRPALL
jgi:hypothetical protein